MFGFYYQLFNQLLYFKLVEKNAYFHGLWGPGSATFLAMCTQFSKCLRESSSASRAHALYMLSTMYNGRRKVFQASSSNPRLIGVLGPTSVLALPLVRTTDVPEEIWKFAIIDLPIVDFVPLGSDGELVAGDPGGLQFAPATTLEKARAAIKPTMPSKKWTVHPSMNVFFGSEQGDGVVMAARCGGRLVGWFNPLAADVVFLSPAYLRDSKYESQICDEVLNAFDIDDEQWQAGKVGQPVSGQPGFQFGVVHSRGSPELRYAAVGFYAGSGEEIVIVGSADQFGVAFERLEVQESGIVIS
ncbi:hypothetical protein MPH_00367 [Macrophomina phaseolina MS6]|uniref:Uncharacterized protein n=1 Tax=Macrophomina phaseolina (strain MS6) TaxID=1126212 RepID=K2T067_MACPH|nr:hypothetical protein MPH_00367 [Macrophomina phaseolina MS6]